MDRLQGNERIRALIREGIEHNNEVMLEALTQVLQERIAEEGRCVLPVELTGENDLKESVIPMITDEEGSTYIPVFTSEEECRRGEETGMETISLERVIKYTLASPEVNGMVIDAWGHSCQMDKPLLWHIIESSEGEQVDYEWKNSMIDKAIHFATECHAGQLRKGTQIPYITHSMEVMGILSRMRADPDLVIAGLLHDVKEDAGVTEYELVSEFGFDVAHLVMAHSEDKSKSWEERKSRAIASLQQADFRTKLLVMADKVSNLRSMMYDFQYEGASFWDKFNAPREQQSWYYSGAVNALAEFRDYDESRPVYWEMVDLFKDLFVSFYYDAASKRIFQMAAHGEAYVLDSSSSDYYLWEEEIPQGSILIDRYQAEEIEDSWRTMSETGGTDKLS